MGENVLFKIYILSGLICLASTVLADEFPVTFEMTYGDAQWNWFDSVQQTSDGGYLLCGGSGNGNDCDIWVVKTDCEGSVEWSRIFSDSDYTESYGKCAIEHSDGEFYVAGTVEPAGVDYSDIVVLKLDEEGNFLWRKTFGGELEEKCIGVGEFEYGDLLIVAGTTSFGSGSTDAWMIRIDIDGNMVWQTTIGSILEDIPHSFAITQPDEDILLCGESYKNENSGRESDYWLASIDSWGYEKFSYIFGSDAGEKLTSIVADESGNIYVSASNNNMFYGRHGLNTEFFRIDSDSLLIWEIQLPVDQNSSIESITGIHYGGFVGCGWLESSRDDVKHGFILQLDETGEILWSRIFRSFGESRLLDITPAFDGGFILAGLIGSPDGRSSSGWLIKTDMDGRVRSDNLLNSSVENIFF
jgi:hypothetical protein